MSINWCYEVKAKDSDGIIHISHYEANSDTEARTKWIEMQDFMHKTYGKLKPTDYVNVSIEKMSCSWDSFIKSVNYGLD